MRLPEGTAIGVTDATAKQAERLLAGDPDIVTYTSYVGQGSPRFWLGLNPVLPNPNFAQIVIVTKDLAGARARQGAARTGARRRRAAGGARPRRPLHLRPAGRLPGAVPRGRTRSDEGARDRRGGAQGHGGQSQDHRPAPRLERAGEVDPARGRPGPRPRARPHAAGRRADAADAALRLDRDAVSRRHRAHRRGGARGSGRAARARPPAGADHRHPQRRRGAAVADRAAQLRVRGADPVAAQPRPGADRARRHRRRRAGARRQQRGGAEAQADQATRCPTAIASRPAARSRRAPRRTPRWSPCSRSWRSRCWRS